MKELSIPCASHHRGTSCSAMLAILRIMQPLDARRRKNDSWAPCCDCYRYRPRRKSYWKIVGARHGVYVHFGCKILLGYDEVVDSWSRKRSSSYQCPECWCNERIGVYGQPKNCKHC
ncbi:hypothetical protein GE09DRAFT_472889 [Coniochaeta sp. 2T2.1]|nr:hypothetical protein GE09DRAFT_472889 [Coniochaeta sp. 2T2.1]